MIRLLFGIWSFELGISPFFGIWTLELGIFYLAISC
jgi:hypothetical protein